MPTPAQLGWVFTRKGRESTRQHLQGGNGARRCRCRRSCDQTRLSPKNPSKGVEPLRSQSRSSPDYRQTKPPTQTNTTPQPPKGATARSGSRQPKEGRSTKDEGGLGHLERN
uniref:Uncharacterized protein n=1 Tax=Oryza barthii TaxID=65489 RepID=A0A0D3HKS3_9ORYZ